MQSLCSSSIAAFDIGRGENPAKNGGLFLLEGTANILSAAISFELN